MNRPTDKRKCQLFHVIPFAVFFLGLVLTVVGATASLKTCKAAGPVLMALSGLLLLCMALLRSRQDRFLSKGTSSGGDHEEHTDTPEHQVNQVKVVCSKNPSGSSLNHNSVEVWVPSVPPYLEMAPPSYEEAVKMTMQ